ncbi:NUDIX domain-containing protein [Streptomyces sp. NA04227]|uniref:NUDIX domain-containing protein n=1 Tax=Streptomyces sp. NA04227 TaxID=2742136 RepID=UPI0020CA6CDC|nr:NUDIX domain-containing protein [Streptomyces sp. NA04227]
MPVSEDRTITPVPHSHCSGCGAAFGHGKPGWPRTCGRCGTTAYGNPLPVAVALQPAYDTRGTGLVVITRAIAPARGATALPGGYVDHREDWRSAVVRELREETGIDAAARDVRLADVMSGAEGHLLVFGLLPPRPAGQFAHWGPTEETEGSALLRRPRELAFPLHTLAARAWFEGRYG